ncbi:MAG: SctK family type III secretion system sorting platform protein [Candidatus Competibacteraceae bacterium]|nr:SctK family type III secretion system sorting platform protein [Candidatus Competibacteraceae bacterium]
MPNPEATAVPERALLAAVCEFNLLPSQFLHNSWLESLPHGEVLTKLRDCSRVRLQLSQYLLKQFGLQNQYCFAIEEPLLRIALLPGADIAALALHAGLCRYSRQIQHTVLREEVLSLREQLGEDAYLFALKRAPFLAPPLDSSTDRSWNAAHCRKQVRRAGLDCLSCAFKDQAAGLLQRLILKLPRHWQDDITNPPWRMSQQQAQTLLAKLMIELNLIEHSHADLPQT